jgi:predicted RNA polymerase sigma factor
LRHAEAVFLARLLTSLRPGEPETEGLLALMLLTQARRAARTKTGLQQVATRRCFPIQHFATGENARQAA